MGKQRRADDQALKSSRDKKLEAVVIFFQFCELVYPPKTFNQVNLYARIISQEERIVLK